MHYEYYEYMIILQIWTDLACAKTFNCYPWKKKSLNIKTKQFQFSVILLIKS